MHEIPDVAFSAGYRFGYLVECRSESMFCDLIGSIPSDIDVVVCDRDGVVYAPTELRPDSLVL